MRHQILEADRSWKEKQPLTDLELEAQACNKCLLEQAEALRMEQEDEIKMLNKVGNSCGHRVSKRSRHSLAVLLFILSESHQFIYLCVCSP